MKAQVNQLKAGSILSYLQMGLSIIIGLLYTPVMLRLLGQSEYGLYSTVSSTISMLSVLSLGFNSSYIRYYARYKKEDNREAIDKLNGLFLIIFSIIGLIALACGLFLSFNLELVFDEGLTAGEYEIARVLMLLLTANLAISFPMSVFQNIISAHEKFIFLKLLGMLKTVASPLITLPLLLLGFRSIAMVSVTLGVSVLTDTAYLIYSKTALKVRFRFGHFEKGLFKSLFAYTSFIAINLIVDQVNGNLGKFILGRFQGTTVVAIYAVGYSLYQYYMMFSTAISGVFTPRIHRIVNLTRDGEISEQRKQLTELFTRVGRIQFLILALIATGLIFFGKPFIGFWAGEGYDDAYYVALLLIIPGSIPLVQNLGIEIQRALNKHQFRSIVYICMAVLNVVLTVILCQRYGAIGTAIGTATSLVVANGFVMNIYYHKKCNIDIIAFWKSIGRLAVGLIIPVICGIAIMNLFDFTSILLLLGGIVVYTLIYAVSMWFLGMNDYEKSLVKVPFQKIFGRHKDTTQTGGEE